MAGYRGTASGDDEEQGLLNGTRHAAVFSPTAAVFALILVTGTCIGISHTSEGAKLFAGQTLKPTTVHANPAANTMIARGTGEHGQLGDAMTGIIEAQLQIFLASFTDRTTPELFTRARNNIKAVMNSANTIQGEGSETAARVASLVDDLDLSANTQLSDAMKVMDAKADPAWMDGGSRRSLLGGESGTTTMEYTAQFGAALNISSAEMLELFPRVAAGWGRAMS